MGPGSILGTGALLLVVGGILAIVTSMSIEAAAALFVVAVLILVIGAATRSGLIWVGLVAVAIFGGSLLFAFLRLTSSLG